MKLSTKGRYGVRIMLDLALHAGETVPLGAIARRQRISQKYLWSIMNTLKSGNLVNVQRGANGGFSLARPAEKITILDILCLLEGYPSIVGCTADPETCNRAEVCTARDVWREVSDKLAAILRDITLGEMRQRHLAQQEKETTSYSI